MPGPLEGVRVLDLSRIVAGPLATQILGDYGAEIIKIEQPGVGDDSRAWVPPAAPDGSAAYFFAINRNKKSVTLNLKHPRGKELLKALVRVADVVIENFKPGTMEELDLGYDQLREVNPRVIYCGISGFGGSGPDRERAGYDSILQGVSGLMSITGERDGHPVKAGVAIVDEITALYAHGAILAALRHRDEFAAPCRRRAAEFGPTRQFRRAAWRRAAPRGRSCRQRRAWSWRREARAAAPSASAPGRNTRDQPSR